ncbi:MAG: ABC transporter substrate-binding protein [Gemmatimonadetes bacterium]|nr:ABC transporter substrate-binding protein [Gemmatimonadota bacterium]
MAARLSLAHGRNADDAFMLYGLLTGGVSTGGLKIECRSEDIETLNVLAINGQVDVSAISVPAYPHVAGEYRLLDSGFAVGDGYGPRLVARAALDPERQLEGRVVAVPGRFTAAHLALRLYEPNVEVRFVRFDEVLAYVRDGFADAGVVSHESQLAYGDLGLRLLVDLGGWWRRETGLPLPLSGFVVRRALGDSMARRLRDYVRASIEYALGNKQEALEYALRVSSVPSAGLVANFIGMYVNDRALDLGADGRASVIEFLQRGRRAGRLPEHPTPDFVGGY